MASISRRPVRRGVAAIEGAVVLGTLFVLVFGMLDLGLAVCRYNTLSCAARALARVAIIRGAKAAPEWPAWGPSSYAGSGNSASEMATVLAPYLCTLSPADVAVQITWPDAGNQVGNRVSVQLNYAYHPLTPFIGYGGPLSLSATSTMKIVH